MLMLAAATTTQAQNFDKFFADSTLRIDYIFSGNPKQQTIAVDELCLMPRWYGKRQRLDQVPVEGNGQITVKAQNGKVIYRNSFSTLFQEWLTEVDNTTNQSFENVFLVPWPKDTVTITVTLFDNRRQPAVSLTHTVNPNDILIRHVGFKPAAPYTTLQKAEDTTRCIHIAYVAEGYRKEEMGTFLADARTATEALFAHEPFKTLRARFNIIAVEAPSEDSGASDPSEGVWKNTALHSAYDTFYSDRYLTTLHLKDLHNWLAGTPYEHIIVLVNDSVYGGGGILNSYNLTSTHHKWYKQVVVHEFGHSFAGLADEYAYEAEQFPMYPEGVEPWEPNITRLVDFGSKWADMVQTAVPTPSPRDLDTPKAKPGKWKVGAYEGAGYALKGVYRAFPDCRMRTNANPVFCPVCQRAITRMVDFYTR